MARVSSSPCGQMQGMAPCRAGRAIPVSPWGRMSHLRDRIRPNPRRGRGLAAFLLAAIVCASALRVSHGSPAATGPGSSQKNASASGKTPKVPKGACISQGGRFPPFGLHGKKPRKASKKREEELTFCRIYKDLTCCNRLNTDTALLSVRMLQIGAEPNEECVQVWEALECSMCHPAVGTQPGPPAICATFCERLYDACQSAFFATDPIANVFMPCSPRDSLCSRGDEWASSAGEFCRLAGYDVVNRSAVDAPQRFCFDGTLAVHSTGAAGQKGAGARPGATAGSSDREQWWEQWFGEDGGAFFGGNIRWAIAGLVLTAAAVFWRWHTMRGKKKRAALLAAKKLAEARMKQQSLYGRSASTDTAQSPMKKKK